MYSGLIAAMLVLPTPQARLEPGVVENGIVVIRPNPDIRYSMIIIKPDPRFRSSMPGSRDYVRDADLDKWLLREKERLNNEMREFKYNLRDPEWLRSMEDAIRRNKAYLDAHKDK